MAGMIKNCFKICLHERQIRKIVKINSFFNQARTLISLIIQFFIIIFSSMIDQTALKVIEIFDQTPIGKLHHYLQDKPNDREANSPLWDMLQWASQHTIRIRNIELFNSKIYFVPFTSFKFSVFMPFKFTLIQNYNMFHPSLTSNSTKQEWVEIWMNVMKKQFFQGNSDLTNLFLLLQLSKMQQKVTTSEPPSPVCWLSCGKQIQFVDKKGFNSFLNTKSQAHFSRKIYGFDAMSKFTMGHDFLTKESPLEAWVAVFARAKLLQSRREYSRCTSQGDLKYLKSKVRQLKKNNVKTEQIVKVEEQMYQKRFAIKEEKMRQKEFDPFDQQIAQKKGVYKSFFEKQKELARFNIQIPDFLKINNQDLNISSSDEQNDAKIQIQAAEFKDSTSSQSKIVQPIVDLTNQRFGMDQIINIPKKIDFTTFKKPIIDELEFLQDEIIRIGSRCVQIYKALLPIYKSASEMVTKIQIFDFEYKEEDQRKIKIQRQQPQRSGKEEVFLPSD